MPKFIFFVLLLYSLLSVPSFANSTAQELVPNAELVGKGRLSIIVWDVYDASLYAPNGTFNPEQPFLLEIDYLRDLKGKDIAEKSAQEMRKQNNASEFQLASWYNQMVKIFPDVQEDTKLSGYYQPNEETIFYKNGAEIGRIKDPEFGKAFFNIWLGEKSSVPQLRKRLLGHLK